MSNMMSNMISNVASNTTASNKSIAEIHADFVAGKLSHNEYIDQSLHVPTSSELQIKLDQLGWSARKLSIRLNCSPSWVSSWHKTNSTPPSILNWLDDCINAKKTQPIFPSPPVDWRKQKWRIK